MNISIVELGQVADQTRWALSHDTIDETHIQMGVHIERQTEAMQESVGAASRGRG